MLVHFRDQWPFRVQPSSNSRSRYRLGVPVIRSLAPCSDEQEFRCPICDSRISEDLHAADSEGRCEMCASEHLHADHFTAAFELVERLDLCEVHAGTLVISREQFNRHVEKMLLRAEESLAAAPGDISDRVLDLARLVVGHSLWVAESV